MAKIPDRLEVTVTQKMIDNAIKHHNPKVWPVVKCPVWRAVQKVCRDHGVEVWVDVKYIKFFRRRNKLYSRKYVKYDVPAEGQAFIRGFTGWATRPYVTPITFTIIRRGSWEF